MASPRSMLMAGPSDWTPTTRPESSAGHRFRQFAKFTLAFTAVCSAAYGGYQAWLQADGRARESAKTAPRQESRKSEKSLFQVLIEADRASLKNHKAVVGAPFAGLWDDFHPGAGGAPAMAAGGDDGGGARAESLRQFFTLGGGVQTGDKRNQAVWSLAFLAPPSGRSGGAPLFERPTATPTPAPAPQTARPAPPRAASQQAGPVQHRPASGFVEARAPAAAASATGFTPVVRTPAPPAPRPAAAEPARPHRDDVEFAAAVVGAADRDPAGLPRAQAVLDEFAKRYPNAAETGALRSRVQHAQARGVEALAERTTLNADIPTAPLLIRPEPLQDMRACFAQIEEIDSVAAVTRPVSFNRDRPAFLVAIATTTAAAARPEQRGAQNDLLRTQLAPQIGPCLESLLLRGSVALSVAAGAVEDPTAQRIFATPDAVVFSRSANPGPAADAPPAQPRPRA